MKKLIASVLTLVCILTLARCGKSDSGDYPATIMVNGINYYSTDHAKMSQAIPASSSPCKE